MPSLDQPVEPNADEKADDTANGQPGTSANANRRHPKTITQTVIIKLVDFDTFPRPLTTTATLSVSQDPNSKTDYTIPEVNSAVLNELSILTGVLEPLQGTVVPRVYRSWVTVGRQSETGRKMDDAVVVVMDDCGERCIGDERVDEGLRWVVVSLTCFTVRSGSV